MKLVIFGAGASYDSIHSYYNELSNANESWKPPLANEIFSNRESFLEIIKDYEGALSLKSAAKVHDYIEEYFQELWDFAVDNNDNLSLSKIINTQYFFQRLFFKISNKYCNIGDSNYDIMSNFAYKYTTEYNKEIVFVSFNYDILLEKAIEKTLHIEFRSIDDYLKYNIKYIKPHGSCNWFKNFKDLEGKGVIFDKTGKNNETFVKNLYKKNISYEIIERRLEDEIVIRDEFNTKDRFGLPQLLLPLKNKDEFVMPNSHLNYLKKYLKKVDAILIIGWKGTEEKFQNLLQECIGEMKLEITTVNNGDNTVDYVMKKCLPNANIKSYNYSLSPEYEGNTDTFTNFSKTQSKYRHQSTYFFK